MALSDRPAGSDQDRFLRQLCAQVEPTGDDPDATSMLKSGPIARGIADAVPAATCFATTIEVGPAGDMEQLAPTYQEQWVHRHGDRADPNHRAVAWAYRCCFTPDDPQWEAGALRGGRTHLDGALDAVNAWS